MNKRRHARLVEIFRALANPNRLALFEAIRRTTKSGPVGCDPSETSCVSAIGAEFDLAPSTLSEHLKELKRAGLISMNKRGRMVYCCASTEALDELRAFVGED